MVTRWGQCGQWNRKRIVVVGLHLNGILLAPLCTPVPPHIPPSHHLSFHHPINYMLFKYKTHQIILKTKPLPPPHPFPSPPFSSPRAYPILICGQNCAIFSSTLPVCLARSWSGRDTENIIAQSQCGTRKTAAAMC